MLILDEPCAGLDVDTERAFYATLNETAEGRTIILIAHRLLGGRAPRPDMAPQRRESGAAAAA